jgi:hypothetical protein
MEGSSVVEDERGQEGVASMTWMTARWWSRFDKTRSIPGGLLFSTNNRKQSLRPDQVATSCRKWVCLNLHLFVPQRRKHPEPENLLEVPYRA